jgi:hypothetical protein
MSRRRPTKADRLRVISIDLLADWHCYAAPLPEPRSEYDWRYFGAITMDGETGALAWRAGSYGFGRDARVRELGLWDRIKINSILLGEPPGYSNAPRFTPIGMSVWPEGRC